MARANWAIVRAIGAITTIVGSALVVDYIIAADAKQAAVELDRQSTVKDAYRIYRGLEQATRYPSDNKGLGKIGPDFYDLLSGGLKANPESQTVGLYQYAYQQDHKMDEILKTLPDGFIFPYGNSSYIDWSGKTVPQVREDIAAAVQKARTQFVQTIYDMAIAQPDYPADKEQLYDLMNYTVRALWLIQNKTVNTADVKGLDVAEQIQTYNQALHFSRAKLIFAGFPTLDRFADFGHAIVPLRKELEAAGGLGFSALFPGESLTDEQAHIRIRAMLDARRAQVRSDAAAKSAVEKVQER